MSRTSDPKTSVSRRGFIGAMGLAPAVFRAVGTPPLGAFAGGPFRSRAARSHQPQAQEGVLVHHSLPD